MRTNVPVLYLQNLSAPANYRFDHVSFQVWNVYAPDGSFVGTSSCRAYAYNSAYRHEYLSQRAA